jgi:glycosyltransferase involved in cell wall biosynthesis
VVQLTDALSLCDGLAVTLMSQQLIGDCSIPSVMQQVDRRVRVSYSRMGLALGLPLKFELSQFGAVSRPTLIHSHGVWQPANHWVARAAGRWQVPLIIQPRGMLEPWALGQKAFKKRVALALFQQADLDSARVFVATSEMEAENLRRLGLRQPVVIIPNGVDLAIDPSMVGDNHLDPNRERIVLFLSRVHPKKGLLELVTAWNCLAPSGWRLRIAGPDDDGHWNQVESRVRKLGLGSSVEYLGPVDGTQKTALYQQADLFILPTFSENFGIVVAEAMAQGLPVITTRGAPWSELETQRCGWWIDTGVEPITRALQTAMLLSDDERRAMGQRGRKYVQQFDWNRIATKTLALYLWLVGQASKPEDIIYE